MARSRTTWSGHFATCRPSGSGESRIAAATSIHLGATLYELVTLRPAFEGADQPRLIDRIVHDQPVRPRTIDRHIPRDLETIVLKAMAKDPKDRFRSAREMAEELRKFIEGRPIRSRPISPDRAILALVQAQPLAGRREDLGRRDDDRPGHRLDHRGQSLLRRSGTSTPPSPRSWRTRNSRGRESLFDARLAQARASRFSRQAGQRFGEPGCPVGGGEDRPRARDTPPSDSTGSATRRSPA